MITEGIQSRNDTYDRIKSDLPRARHYWLSLIVDAGSDGVTAFELSEQTDIPQNVFSGRITELVAAGQVVRTKRRRPTMKSTASVIVATEFYEVTK